MPSASPVSERSLSDTRLLRRPLVIGHRGASGDAPENTRSALDMAMAGGSDGIEIDVQMSKDGIPVLHHDRTLRKVTGSWKRVSDFSFHQLQRFDWGNWFSARFRGEPILSLSDVLREFAPRTQVMVEIKSSTYQRRNGNSRRLTETVLAQIRRIVPESVRNNIFLLSFDPAVLDHVHEAAPDLSCVLNINGAPDNGFPSYLHACCCPVRKLTPQRVDKLHRGGLQVMTFCCNTARQADHAIRSGADVLISDRPGWLVSHLTDNGRAAAIEADAGI